MAEEFAMRHYSGVTAQRRLHRPGVQAGSMCFAPFFSSFFVFGAGVTPPRSSTLFLPGHAHVIAGQEQDDDFAEQLRRYNSSSGLSAVESIPRITWV